MEKHIKIYLTYFGYTPADFIPSEIKGRKADDIHHIHRRGKGGSEDMDKIENLMALTRQEHIEFGDKKQFKAFLYARHLEKLEAFGKPFNKEWIESQIAKYEAHAAAV